jgi:hypothetical protein
MTFDTLEIDILNQLKAGLPYLLSVEGYAGQLESDIEKLPIPFPAAFVAYGGSSFEWVDGEIQNETCEFTILAAAKNLRSRGSARTDPGTGAYKMINDILATLANRAFNEDMERLQPKRVDLIYVSKTAAIYGIVFQANFDRSFAMQD